MEKITFKMNDASVKKVCEQDPVMKKLIMTIGDIEVVLRTEYFASLVRSIIGQQISVSAASAIYGRLQQLLNDHITAEGLLEQSTEDLRSVGLTKQKTKYVQDLAGKVASGELDLQHLATYDDKMIVRQLTNVKGIGKWTAEVFLLLTLGRQDVLAADDVGLQRAAQWLYKTEKSERRNILVEKSELWKPYRSIAVFYLWEAIHLGYVVDYGTVEEVERRKDIDS